MQRFLRIGTNVFNPFRRNTRSGAVPHNDPPDFKKMKNKRLVSYK